MPDEYTEYRFQIVVKRNVVKMVLEDGTEYEYPRDSSGIREVLRFIVGRKKTKKTPVKYSWTAISKL